MKIKTFVNSEDSEVNNFLAEHSDAEIIGVNPIVIKYGSVEDKLPRGVYSCREAVNGFIAVGIDPQFIMDAWHKCYLYKDSPYSDNHNRHYNKELDVFQAKFTAESDKSGMLVMTELDNDTKKWQIDFYFSNNWYESEEDYAKALREECGRILGDKEFLAVGKRMPMLSKVYEDGSDYYFRWA